MRLGDLLIQKKLVSASQLQTALEEQRRSREFLGEILVRKGAIREKDLVAVLSEQFHIPSMDLEDQYIDWNVVMRFPSSLIVEHQCLPIHFDDAGYTVAIVDPLNALAISEMEK